MEKGNELIGDINIKPKVDFDNGISLNVAITAGGKGKEVISTLPDYVQSNPLTATLEINIDDADKGPGIVATLEGVKDMIVGMTGTQEMLDQGVGIRFRHVGKSVFVDVTLEGGFAEMAKAQLQAFNIDLSAYSECGEFHLISGLKLNKPLETSYEDAVKMATQFKVQGNGNMPAKSLYAQLETIFTGDMMPKKVKKLFKFAKILTVVRRMSYSCDYNSEDMCEYVKQLAGRIAHNTMGGASMSELNAEMGTQIISSFVSEGQETAKMQIEGIKGMAMQFLEPYLDSLKILNLDNISLSIVSTDYNAMIKFNLNLVGITEFAREYFLN